MRFATTELGVSLTTYLASASVIGLAVSFGSRGVVQDVSTGLTLVFSDLLDLGDMADPIVHEDAVRRPTDLAEISYEQYPGILLLPPTVARQRATRGGYQKEAVECSQ